MDRPLLPCRSWISNKATDILALVDGELFVALGPLLDLWFRPLAGGQVWRQPLGILERCGVVLCGVVWCGVVVWRQVGILELVENQEGAPLDAAHTPILRRSWHVSRG